MKRRLQAVALVTAIALELAGCASSPEPAATPPPDEEIASEVDPWHADAEEGSEAFEAGRFVDAIAAWKRALAAAVGNPDIVGELRQFLAQAHFEVGEFDRARIMAAGALPLLRSRHGRDDPHVAACLVTLGGAELALHLLKLAQIHLEIALEIFDASGQMGDPSNVGLLTNLGRIHFGRHRYRAAEGYYQRALRIYRGALARDDVRIGTSLADLGAVYFETRRPRMSLQAFQRAYQILRSKLGPNHPTVTRTRDNLEAARQRIRQKRKTPRVGI